MAGSVEWKLKSVVEGAILLCERNASSEQNFYAIELCPVHSQGTEDADVWCC